MSDIIEQEIQTSPAMLSLLQSGEIDMQIATAHKYPRSLKAFRNMTLEMVTLSKPIAQECIYALKRGNKTIEGPSARFAEIVVSAWGNCRAGARVVDEGMEFVTAQGVFHDLERNVAITYEVKRRIVDSNGKRYNVDMIGVTGNAASSIALRNAILKGIPKAFWSETYAAARHIIAGDVKTLASRRDEAIQAFAIFGVTPEMIFKYLEVKGKEDITIEHLVVMNGTLTALREGDTTVEMTFDMSINKQPQLTYRKTTYTEAKFKELLPQWKKLIESGDRKPADIIAMVSNKVELSAEQKKTIEALKPAAQTDNEFLAQYEASEAQNETTES